MATLLTSPWEGFLIAFLLVFAIYLLYRSTNNFTQGLEYDDNPFSSIFVISGVRSFILSMSFFCLAAGLFFETNWPIYIGLGFLAEEIIDTCITLYRFWSYKRNLAKESE